jgi:O-succinylbenzoic acid--CoA ligase
MNKTQPIIRINGHNYKEEKLDLLIAEKLASPQLPDWEVELYTFLQAWFTDSKTIVAQTSGSTGEPTSIELPKQVMIKSAERTIEYFGLRKGNRILLSLPCRYIAGKMMVVRAIAGQMDLCTVDPSSEFDLLLNDTFAFGAMVSNQVFKLLEVPSGIEKLEHIHNLLIGGSSIPTTMETTISHLKSRVVSTYGMTETASHIAIRELSGEKRSDVYNCLKGISVTLSENDCLQIHVQVGHEPLQTNDIAEVLSPTSFRILGRADDVIISGGIKYWPETIEKKLESLISKRFIISAMPDEKLGEKIVLVIEDTPIDIEGLQQRAAELLSPFERPKLVCFLEKFPQTPNGKLRRNEIKWRIQGQ